jgi:hypothetical protein
MRGKFATIVLGSIATAALGVSALAVAQETTLIKQKMGENFAGMQIILTSLMMASYAAAPDQVTIIADHASYLMHEVPDNAKKDRDEFLAYAYSLQGHARDLRSTIEQLIEQDKAIASGQPLETNDLREAAAAHYGGMVTACVSCHNHFRPQITQ